MGEVLQFSRLTQHSQSTPRAGSLSTLRPVTLLTPRRMDLAVKFRFFRHLHGGNDPDSERVYRWHINERSGPRMRAGIETDKWKLSLDDYVTAADKLLSSMACDGFQSFFAVPVDPKNELLDGSHRVACALALDLPVIVVHSPRPVWAPPWDEQWFIAHGMADDDLARMRSDWKEMNAG